MVLHFCLSQSTAHGLGNIGNESHISGKIIWFILTIMMTTFFIFHTILLYSQLQEEQILISTHNYAVDFVQPDIVFCSEKMLARDFVIHPPENEFEYISKVAESIEEFERLFQNSTDNSNSIIWDSLNYHHLYKAFFHRKHEFFLNITCNLRDINLSSMKEEVNSMYFACYRFNSSYCSLKTPLDNLVVKFYIHNYESKNNHTKLKLLINGRSIDTYLFSQRDRVDEMENGIHVYFTNPGDGVTSIDPKVTAQLNTHTYINLKATEYQRLQTKKFKCKKNKTYIELYNLLEENILDNPVKVSEYSICIQAMFQIEMYKNLYCVSTQFPIPKEIPSNFSLCGNLSSPQHFPSFMNFWRRQTIKNPIMKECKEKRLCFTKYYSTIVNYNYWPRILTLKNIFKTDISYKLRHDNLSRPGLRIAYEDFKKNPSNINKWKTNFLKISISPADFKSTLVEESLQYTFKNFFSDVGGIMGLYMGASLLTLCEIFRLIHYFLHRKLESRKGREDVEIQSPNDISAV